LLFEKLGITEEELDKVSSVAVDYCKRSARKFEDLSWKMKVDLEQLIMNGVHPAASPDMLNLAGGTLYDLPRALVNIFINSIQVYQFAHIHAEGEGSGLRTIEWDGHDDHYDGFVVDYEFGFFPPSNGFYNFSAGVIASGPYFLVADDGSCDSKEVSMNLSSSIRVRQTVDSPVPGKPPIYILDDSVGEMMYEEGSQNINRLDIVAASAKLEKNGVFLIANEGVKINVSVGGRVMAKGEGSIGDVNLSQGNGGIACLGLRVQSA
jgi:hypothetical protein